MTEGVKAAWIGVIGAAIGAVVTVGLSKLFPEPLPIPPTVINQISAVVPPSKPTETNSLPNESKPGDDYQLIKDISIFDLRQWVPTPDSLIHKRRWCPVNYTNYLHVKKTHEMDTLVIHYGTSGFTIDMRCVTNRYTFYKSKTNHFKNGHLLENQFSLNIYIGDMPLNAEFLVVVEATYWNGFANEKKESATTYTDKEIHGLDELGLVILFPENKPYKNELRLFDSSQNGTEQQFSGLNILIQDINRHFVYWDIKNREPDHDYRLEWDW